MFEILFENLFSLYVSLTDSPKTSINNDTGHFYFQLQDPNPIKSSVIDA